ncbi:hypothetical protein ACFIJ5_07560 [Haloimpatiens sp. FM7330]|uniref:hypothetical protein n=1 Tax=Haloimpatiens sp. FM7330 TaxID=3298610 RepID=UPI00362CEFAD
MASYMEMVKYRVQLRKIIQNPDKEYFIKNILSKYDKDSDLVFGHALSDFQFSDLKNTIQDSKNMTLGRYIQYLVDSKGIKKDSIVYTKANLTKEYWSKLINNKTANPSKYKIIRIGLALKLNCKEINELLKVAGYSFKPNNRDSAIIWFFDNHIYDFPDIDELLTTLNLEPIFDA